jgi:membrane-associated phospholipid phosphatase
MLFPAGGPFRFIEYSVPLEGPLIYDRTAAGVMAASNAVDVFPSVHFAATLYLLLFDWGHRRWHFWVMLLPCVLLWIATMYLRYHYAVDLVAGVGVALAGWFAAHAYERSGIAALVDARERAAAASTEKPTVPASAKPQIISSSGQIPE